MFRRLFAVLLFAVAVSAATPAHAATLTIDVLDCNSLRNGRKTTGFLCEAYVSGGTGGNTYTWSVRALSQEDWANGSTLNSQCSVGTWQSVQLTVRDSSGARATPSRSFYCYGNM